MASELHAVRGREGAFASLRPGRVEVACVGGTRELVDGLVWGVFAFHCTGGRPARDASGIFCQRWVVTHRPSGMCVGAPVIGFDRALALAKALERLPVNWPGLADAAAFAALPESSRGAVRELVARVHAGVGQ